MGCMDKMYAFIPETPFLHGSMYLTFSADFSRLHSDDTAAAADDVSGG